ncbi:MAG TPA: type II toxin-antitoxin system RelE/ParE family toxin [Dehalococcoidia bacterium]|nr:type II toxin-antitoxin system RelE/ParE family toxin [Dehalococcoidia bacterium]
MPVRVELIDEAVEDLARYARGGNLPLFLKKLLRLEEVGRDAGLPLGASLTGWRKMVAGDRNWRIIFTTDPNDTVATVWVIGDRDDSECYEDAERRVRILGRTKPEAQSLAAVLFQLNELRRTERRSRRRRR